MAYSTVTRNLRDGSIVVKDGTTPTPKSVTVICDEGNLTFTTRRNYTEILCRGQKGGVREGDFAGTQVSFTARWQQLVGYSEDSSDPYTLFEILENKDSLFASVADGYYAVKIEFTVSAPDGDGNDEKITFAEFRREDVQYAEGNPASTIAVNGVDNNAYPLVEVV